jgi:oxygen-independent coproporphyrinogen III oxidase
MRRLASSVLPRHLYVHVPFCVRRCSYCDFSIAVRGVVPVDDYLGALGSELALRFADAERWELDTLYVGGGTPSRLGPGGVRRLLEMIGRHASLAPGAEVTLEVNPEDVTVDAACAWVRSHSTIRCLRGCDAPTTRRAR